MRAHLILQKKQICREVYIRHILHNVSRNKNSKSFFLLSWNINFFWIKWSKISRHLLFVFFLFFSLSGPFQSGRSKVSRHYFVFVFLLLYIIPYLARDSCKKWQEKLNRLRLISRVDSQKFLVTILFFVFVVFFFLLYSYLARDSCKKWQEIINKQGLISRIKQLRRK